MKFAAFVYHVDFAFTLKLFPAGKHNEIDWSNIVYSDGNFDFYLLKDSGAKEKSYVEYSTDSEYNINPLRLKETVRYKCQISDSDNQDKISYESDYVNLTQAVAEECSALLLEYSSPTSLTFSQNAEKQKIDLYYNRTFSHKIFENSKYEGSYSRPFRPDYTVAIYPKAYENENKAVEDGAVSYIHFDAKYRLEDLSQFINREESEAEINKEISEEKGDSVMNTYRRGDLLKMHTYNDAIRRTVGSYVLYPGTDNKNGKCFSVYEEILPGVGAFAIRPSDVNKGELNAGEKAVQDFIKEVVAFNANPASRNARADYFDRMIAESPSEKHPVDFDSQKSDSNLYMLGFIRNEYYDWLKNGHLVPSSADDSDFLQTENGIYFYYHAIRDGYVYPLHKDLAKAKYFLASRTDFGVHKKISEYVIEPWIAEISSTELVSSETLACRLKEMKGKTGKGYEPKDAFNAQFYYLVRLKNIRAASISSEEITIIDSGNLAISPYSPKIVKVGK